MGWQPDHARATPFGDIVVTSGDAREPFAGWTAEGLGMAIRSATGDFSTDESRWRRRAGPALLMSALVVIFVALARASGGSPRWRFAT